MLWLIKRVSLSVVNCVCCVRELLGWDRPQHAGYSAFVTVWHTPQFRVALLCCRLLFVLLLSLRNPKSQTPKQQAVGDGTGIKPIYESLMDLKGLPFLESCPDSLAHHITATEAGGCPAVTFGRVERVGAIVDVLRHTQHNGFAVIERGMDGEQHIMGVVLRSQLGVLLRSRRCFQPTSFVSEVRGGRWVDGQLAGHVAFSYQGSDVTHATHTHMFTLSHTPLTQLAARVAFSYQGSHCEVAHAHTHSHVHPVHQPCPTLPYNTHHTACWPCRLQLPGQ